MGEYILVLRRLHLCYSRCAMVHPVASDQNKQICLLFAVVVTSPAAPKKRCHFADQPVLLLHTLRTKVLGCYPRREVAVRPEALSRGMCGTQDREREKERKRERAHVGHKRERESKIKEEREGTCGTRERERERERERGHMRNSRERKKERQRERARVGHDTALQPTNS